MNHKEFHFAAALAFALAACSMPTGPEYVAQLRDAAMCGEGCECVCPGTSSSSSSSSSSTGMPADLPPDLGPDPDSSSSGGPPTTLAEAVAQMGGVYSTGTQDDEAWADFPDGRRFRMRWRFWDPDDPSAVRPNVGGTTIRPVFAFHAASNNGASNGQWDSYRHPNNGAFLVVLPESAGMLEDPLDPDWHTDPTDGTDFPFVQDVIEAVESWPFVDASNRYLTGWSAGTFMSQSVACELGATALVAGSGGIEYLNSANGLPSSCMSGTEIWLHHGQSDTTVPITFGQDARDLWAGELGCSAPSSSVYPLDWCAQGGVSCSGSGTGCVSYTCTDGALTWCEDDSGHTQGLIGAAQRNVGELLFNP